MKLRFKKNLFRVFQLGFLLVGTATYAALNGTYTINSGAPASATNYTSVTAAVSDLISGTRPDGGPINGPGVTGPVDLRIVAGSGPYTEQITFGLITGTSATNYVRLTGGPTREQINFTNTTITDRQVIKLSGTKNIILDSLTIVNNGTTYGFGVHITNNSDSNFVQNCVINIDTLSTSSNFAGITISGSGATTNGNNGDYNTIQNNVVSGGYYGFSCHGSSTTVFSQNNIVINNEFKDFYYYGIRHYGQINGVISNNVIHARSSGSTAGYGIYSYYQVNSLIERNKIYRIGSNAIYCAYQNVSSSTRSVIKNNFISDFITTGTANGIYLLTSSNNVDVFHNSVSITAGNGRALYITSGSGNDIRNNSFSIINSITGYAAYISSLAYITNMDYNNYYAPGSSNFVYLATAFTPTTYQGGNGFNLNSIDGNPNYVDFNNDLHVYATQLFDKGDPTVIVTNDFDNEGRPYPNSLIPDIGADEYLPDSIDISVDVLLDPSNNICPDSNQVVSVIISNKGTNSIFNIPITADVTGVITTTLNATYTDTIALGQTDTLQLGTINTWSGGNFNFKVYSNLSNDQSRENDTLVDSRFINLTPVAPSITPMGDTICSGDSSMFIASSTGTNYWFDAKTGGTLLAVGDTLNTGPVSATKSFFVEARGTAVSSLTTTFANNNSCGGGNMFDITATADVTIDSLDLHMSAGAQVIIYYKLATHTGSETNALAWTAHDTINITAAAIGTPTRCVIKPLNIPNGQTYGIYVYTTTIVYTTLPSTTNYTSPEMTLTAGTGLCGQFSGTNNPRGWNGTVYYTAEGCPSQRSEVVLTAVNPLSTVVTYDTTLTPTIVFTATNSGGPADSIHWDFGDGSTGTGSMPSHTYTSPGTYTVILTQNNICGTEIETIVLNVFTSTGIQEIVHGEVLLYPNPTKGKVNLKLDGLSGLKDINISVVDMMGRTHINSNIINAGSLIELDVEHLYKGIYIIQVSGEKFNWRASLVKE